MIILNKTALIAILGTGIVVALIVIISNFNVQINVNGNKDSASANQQTDQTVQGSQEDSMTSMHGGAKPADETDFNSLLGKPAPDFTLESYDGKKITLSSLKGENVILFFNEGLMCYPACWNQIVAFGKDDALKNKAVILNITADPKNEWEQAINKMPELAQSTVIFDTNRQVSGAYGVLTLPSSMHKGQFPGHTYIIVNKEGIIKFVKDDVQMAVRNQEINSEIDKL